MAPHHLDSFNFVPFSEYQHHSACYFSSSGDAKRLTLSPAKIYSGGPPPGTPITPGTQIILSEGVAGGVTKLSLSPALPLHPLPPPPQTSAGLPLHPLPLTAASAGAQQKENKLTTSPLSRYKKGRCFF